MIERRDDHPSSNQLGCLLCATVAAQGLSEVSRDSWVQIELTANTGACDSVMPKTGPCAHIKIHPSAQSEVGILYEVASSESTPKLGERRLSIWTEGAGAPKGMAIQVADVHKPLLSLSRCADLGYERQFGKSAGFLIDKATEDILPLHRVGNLDMLRAWVKAEPDRRSLFDGPS